MSKRDEKTQRLRELSEMVRHFIESSAKRGVLERSFNQVAKQVYEFQFEFNLPYQLYCKRLGRTPENVSDYREIPAVVTSAFKDLELTALEVEERSRVFYSSGTTHETRSRHFHNETSLGVYRESVLAGFEPFVMGNLATAHFLMLTPPAEEAPNSSLIEMFSVVGERYEQDYLPEQVRAVPAFTGISTSDGAWELDFTNVLDFAEAVKVDSVPVVVCGTAFSFVHLCDSLHERHHSLTFPAGSRVFETGGYKGRSRSVSKAELHGLIERYLGVPQTHIISEYGMSELSSQAYDRRVGEDTPRLFRFPPWAQWAVISPETGRPVADGRTGLLRVWDMANVASVLAIQTEDLATRSDNGFVLAGRASRAEVRGCSLMNV